MVLANAVSTASSSAVLSGAPPVSRVLAQAPDQHVIGVGEAVVFWILGPLAVLGALGMIFARSAVHSALWLVMTMLSLGVLYMAQNAQFLGFTQVIVYTGAVMMLFLFVLMMVGRESSDSVVEVLRGQRLAAALLGIGFAVLLALGLARSLTSVQPAAPVDPWSPRGGGAGGLGRLIFTDYLFPFELTSALLITAALGAMVLAYGGKGRSRSPTQRETVEARLRGEYARVSPSPGPGVYATANSVATPALLPDGSVAPESLSEILDNTQAEQLSGDRASVAGSGAQPHPRALTGEALTGEALTGEALTGHPLSTSPGDGVEHPSSTSSHTNGGAAKSGATNGDASSAETSTNGGKANGDRGGSDSAPESSEEARQ